MKRQEVRSVEAVEDLIKITEESIVYTMGIVRSYKHGDDHKLFYDMKFKQIGKDPLQERPLNIIEQINQTFTYLVTFHAVKKLFQLHPEKEGFVINLGTESGYDIVSTDGSVIAEVFAATSVSSNQKLKKDIQRLAAASGQAEKYVFYHTPQDEVKETLMYQGKHEGIKIVKMNLVD